MDASMKGAQMPELPGVSRFWSDGISISWTSKATGSFALTEPNLPDRYRSLTGGNDVVYTRQVHGAVVVDATAGFGVSSLQGSSLQGSRLSSNELREADGLISAAGGPAIAVITADCAPIVIWSPDGVIGVAHAGWRGLVAGVVEATVKAVRERSADPHSLQAALGPSIGPCCYEFGIDELALVSKVYGESVRSVTTEGSLALDMRAGVLAALDRSDVEFARHLGGPDDPYRAACTACGPGWFSWRRNQDSGRQALVVESQSGGLK
jgi:polyphenol oxidase